MAQLLGIGATTIINNIGTDILMKTLSSSSSAVCNSVSHILDSEHPYLQDVRDELEYLDLEYIVGVMEELIDENKDMENMKNSVKRAVIGVDDILKKMFTELEIIKQEINLHQSKYFNYWRR